MFILVSKDLFFVPTVKAATENCDMPFMVALNHDSQKVLDTDAADVKVCLVDLSDVSSKALVATADALRERFPSARLAAFAPHVHEAKLAAAAAAGFDPVLSRGQVSSQLPRLLAAWQNA